MRRSKQERFYIIDLPGDKIRFRNILRKKNGESEPMLQVETKVDSK